MPANSGVCFVFLLGLHYAGLNYLRQEGHTPLKLAAMSGSLQVVMFLVEDAKVDVDTADLVR